MPRKEYYRKNPDIHRKSSNEYYGKNKEECLRKTRERNASNPDKNRARVRKWAKDNPEKRKVQRLNTRRRKNGFSQKMFDDLLKDQFGLCAICGIVLEKGLTCKAACADHCHKAKTPRGILCKKCNLLLGHSRDDVRILVKAIEYLLKWERTA